MAYLIGCEQVDLAYAAKRVFDRLTIAVNSGQRIGIVGTNGQGKSSLLGILSGAIEPDAGKVTHRGSVNIGLLTQSDTLSSTDTVRQAIVGKRPEYEWASDAGVRSILEHLVGDIDWDAQIGMLSGGQRRRVDLARVLIGDFDVLMLDETTNHLDIEGIHWLSKHLKNRWKSGEGALLVVTHDRWFLDEVCTSMFEVHNAGITAFEGGFSAYIMQRVERKRQADIAASKRKNALARELAWLARGVKARSSKPKFRVEAAKALIACEPAPRRDIKLKTSAITRLGKKVVNLVDASVKIDGRVIIEPTEWRIGASERIGILGANGAGKTTLLRLIEGKIKPSTGRVEIGKTVKFAHLSQNLDELVRLGNARVCEVCNRYKLRVELANGRSSTPAQLLEDLGFEPEALSTPVCDLSGGQKRRLQLMLILLDQPNVLILDEPGNDLDCDMLAQLECLLDSWPGTLLLVSHDRYLIERATDMQYALVDARLRHMPGGVQQYIDENEVKVQAKTGTKAHNKAKAKLSKKEKSRVGDGAHTDKKLGNKEIFELKKRRSSTERKMSTARTKVAQAQAELEVIDACDYIALGLQQEKIAHLKDELGTLEDTWLEIEVKLEQS